MVYMALPDQPVDLAARFGGFQRSDRRPQVWAKFLEFVHEAQACGLIDAIIYRGWRLRYSRTGPE
jgi:hypothetical protein